MRNVRKGQTGVEFIVSSVIFLVTVSYASLTIINNMPIYHDYADTEDLSAKSYQLSEYLLFNYLASEPTSVPLEKYVIDKTKLESLRTLCETSADSNAIRAGLMTGGKDVDIIIDYIDQTCTPTLPLHCTTSSSGGGKKIIIKRFAVLEDCPVRVDVALF